MSTHVHWCSRNRFLHPPAISRHLYINACTPANPGAPLTKFNDRGGSDRGSYFIPKKITSKFVYPKKSLLFLAYPKKSLLFLAYPKKSLTDSPFFTTPKNPSVFFCDPKIPASFIDPKNHFWLKFWTQKNHLDPPPPVIKICEWGPWACKLYSLLTTNMDCIT